MKNFRVTKREVLFSIIIICLLVTLGMFINDKMQQGIIDREEKFYRALKIEDVDSYQYAVKTNAGNLLLYDTAVATQPVSIPEIKGEYSKITKVTEKYTKHTRTKTYTDSNGNKRKKQVTEYSWDKYNSEEFVTQKMQYMGEMIPIRYFGLGSGSRLELKTNVSSEYKTNVHSNYIYNNSSFLEHVGDVRYSYYVYPATFEGTMFVEYDETGKNKENTEFFYNKSIQGTLDSVTKSVKNSGIIFWIIWVILMVLSVFGFCYLDNKWLEDKKKEN